MYYGFVSFAVSVHISIRKQPPPSPFSLFIPSLTYCKSLYHNLPKSQITLLQQIHNSLARAVVKSHKSSHITPILRSREITQLIEYKLLSLTKFSQQPNCHIAAHALRLWLYSLAIYIILSKINIVPCIISFSRQYIIFVSSWCDHSMLDSLL